MHTEKILMFGGQGSGKSSVLAAVFDQAVSLTAGTNLTIKLDRESAEPILDRLHMIKTVCFKRNTEPFEMPGAGTQSAEEYSFDLGLSGQKPDLKLTFIDTKGEWMSRGVMKLSDYFKECRAAILAIDAVELMQGDDVMPADSSLHRNLPAHTRQMIAEWIDTQGDSSPRLLCIVPIKTETYMRERKDFDVKKDALKLSLLIKERYEQLVSGHI